MPGIAYFFLSVVTLLAGYFIYGRVMDRVFKPDENRRTPAVTMEDGVDYTVLPPRELFYNQFLSITGIGPVFGPILGILYGPAALFWIVFGSILAGGVHDYLSGMMSLRYRGESIPDVVGRVLGRGFRVFMRLFSLVLLILVGVVFAIAPAELLASLTRIENDRPFWLILIFAYYFLATVWPIEILINRITPFFTVVLAVMAVGVLGALMFGGYDLYSHGEGWLRPHPKGLPMWPLMLVTIACGAISGFHATQSPITARCLGNERLGRRIFYGAMILEGLIALVWATAGMTLYQSSEALQAALTSGGPSGVVSAISLNLLGDLGGLLAILGVVALPITSGDTAFRASRLIVADFFNLPQKSIASRLKIAVPVLGLGVFLSQVDFEIIWRYFAWSNQTLATLVLWAGAAYLVRRGAGPGHWVATAPAVFMTAVVMTYILYVDIGFRLPYRISVVGGGLAALAALILFLAGRRRFKERVPLELAMEAAPETPRSPSGSYTVISPPKSGQGRKANQNNSGAG